MCQLASGSLMMHHLPKKKTSKLGIFFYCYLEKHLIYFDQICVKKKYLVFLTWWLGMKYPVIVRDITTTAQPILDILGVIPVMVFGTFKHHIISIN